MGGLLGLDKQNFIQMMGGSLIPILEKKGCHKIVDIIGFVTGTNFLKELHDTVIHFIVVQSRILELCASEHKPEDETKMDIDSKASGEKRKVGLHLHVYIKGKLEVVFFEEGIIYQWMHSAVDGIIKRKNSTETSPSQTQTWNTGPVLMQFAFTPMANGERGRSRNGKRDMSTATNNNLEPSNAAQNTEGFGEPQSGAKRARK